MSMTLSEIQTEITPRGSLLILDRRHLICVGVEIMVTFDRDVFRNGTFPLVQPKVG